MRTVMVISELYSLHLTFLTSLFPILAENSGEKNTPGLLINRLQVPLTLSGSSAKQ